jgi:hypothetical protein
MPPTPPDNADLCAWAARAVNSGTQRRTGCSSRATYAVHGGMLPAPHILCTRHAEQERYAGAAAYLIVYRA